MRDIGVKFTLSGDTATIDEDFTLAGVTVTKGFESDGISSPSWTWFRYHPFSEWCPAAFVHDFCIEQHGYATARDQFIKALVEMEAKKIDQVLLYSAVRLKDWHRRNFDNDED